MRIVGYCTGCRRVKPVTATGHGLALGIARVGVPEGVCADCEEEERNRRTVKPKGRP